VIMANNPLLVILLVLVSTACVILAIYSFRNTEVARSWRNTLQRSAQNKPIINKDGSTEMQKTQSETDIEKMIADRRMLRGERSAGFCSKCGRAVQQSDMYCPGCGEKVG